jgi:DNA end-binding protein Ku
MFFSSEVRADEEYTADTGTVTQKELDLAQTLVHSLATAFQPVKYSDTYREKLESIIARKIAGQPVAIPEKPSRTTSVVDITEALQKSLAALKKPAASEKQSREVAKGIGARRKKMADRAG